MGSFEKAKKLEEQHTPSVLSYLREDLGLAPTPLISNDRTKLFTLQRLGDFIAFSPDENQQHTFEWKIERQFTGNLFMELWSNRKAGRPGWMVTSEADWLIYAFAIQGMAWVYDWKQMKEWLWHPTYAVDTGEFPLRSQGKYDQHNDTWGYLVKMDLLKSKGFLKDTFRLSS
jgi:hypothetical protein